MPIISCTHSIVAVVVAMSHGIMGVDAGVGGRGVYYQLYRLDCLTVVVSMSQGIMGVDAGV